MRFTISPWHLRVLAAINGVPADVSGLREPLLSPYHPNCSMYTHCVMHNLSPNDWSNLSKFIRIRLALLAFSKSVVNFMSDYSSDSNKIISKYLGGSAPVFNLASPTPDP